MAPLRRTASSWLSASGEEISENALLKIYEIHEKEMAVHLDLHYKNRNYYMTLISALLAIFVGGLLQFYEDTSSFILLAIPISVLILSELGKKTMDQYYENFLESVVVLAKIEHILRLDKCIKSSKSKSQKVLWAKDKQFVLNRWVKDRYEYDSSEQFVNERKKKGDNRYAHWVFNVLEVVTVVLGILGCWILLQIHL